MGEDETVSVPGFDHAVKDPEEGKLQIRGDSKIILLEGNYIMVSDCHFVMLQSLSYSKPL
jgi:pantothenate kinase